MPTSDNSSDEHEKSMCESDASDVSVTEHTPPLPTGEGQGGGAFAAIKAYYSPPCGGGAGGGAYSSSVGLISSICSCTMLRLNTLSSIV